ncbi:hypothetical protein [Acetobacter musti]|uniref:hypothetical protein n=1 Tax=Acetobacter musti TaxID=864732 RepID=UPI00156ABC53|nr:hypothetical protein [Acetobacter musti]
MTATDRELLETRIEVLEFRIRLLSKMVATLIADGSHDARMQAEMFMSEVATQTDRQMTPLLAKVDYEHLLGPLHDDLDTAVARHRR